ncbi:MAG: hypothetical protein ABIA21_01615 [Candidatus Aenigmatarchaeota archaeon]
MAEHKPSKDEQIGFHKGSLTTLSNERQELLRIVQVVEQLMGMHMKALEELGVKLDMPKDQKPASKSEPKERRSFDEMFNDKF